jgi:hypothetical protein
VNDWLRNLTYTLLVVRKGSKVFRQGCDTLRTVLLGAQTGKWKWSG